MQTDNAPNATVHARSKVEFLYRELLIEVGHLQHRNSELAQELRQISISLAGAPQAVSKAMHAASAQATEGVRQQLDLAGSALTSAQQDLRQTGQVLLASSLRSAWYVGLVAGGCGLVGAVLGVLLGAWLLSM